MKVKILSGTGAFDLLTDVRDPGVVIAESDYNGALLRFAGDNATITMRANKYRTRIPRDKVGPLIMRLLDK